MSSHDTSEHVSERERNPDGCERVVRHERYDLVIDLFYLTNHADGRMAIGPPVWCFGFARIFEHRGIDQQRAGQDEWAWVARRLRLSRQTVCPVEIVRRDDVRGDGPYKRTWAYRLAKACDKGPLATGGTTR